MRTGSRRHRISTVFQVPGRRADSLRIGRYTNFLDTTSPVDLWTENHEVDDDGKTIKLNVKTEAHGLGSRFDAKLFRTVVENILTDQDITAVLDFNDVEIVSLSFADELINKLKKRIGVDQFNRRVRLVNLSCGCRSIFSGIIENY